MTEDDDLVPLCEWNEWRREQVMPKPYPRNNGLACPKCGAELQDSDSVILTSNPTQRNINCSKCDYRGYRIA